MDFDLEPKHQKVAMQLNRRRALITGGGRGIGRAIALAYARAGADVAVTARSTNQINEVADAIRDIGRAAHAVACDVSDLDAVTHTVETTVAAIGGIDILVNNAGGGEERTSVGEDNPTRWKRVIDVNLLGVYYCTRAALPHLKSANHSTVINIGSGMGHQPVPGNSSYNAAKAGVWMLTRCLAQELWKDGITINELIPGPVYTELTSEIFEPGSPHPKFPSEWVKPPDDVVDLALFLATQSHTGPTGQSFSLARRPI